MSKKRVFIIYGRDLEARDALASFLETLDLEVIKFENVAGLLGPAPFVADVVLKAINTADAIIALFTPDEHAALYRPDHSYGTLAKHEQDRWQARPNVIFEAGVALGSRPEQTILATLGVDVQLFSDVNGKHFVRLDTPDGKAQLWGRLNAILFPNGEPETDLAARTASKSFASLARRRWDFYDEVFLLANRMRNQMLGKRALPPTLLDIVTAVVLEQPMLDSMKVQPKGFMGRVARLFPKYANNAYWWLIVFGFFRFTDDENWGITKDEDWESSAPCAEMAERGEALVRQIQLGTTDG